MTSLPQKLWFYLSISLLLVLFLSFIFYPRPSIRVSGVFLVLSLGVAVYFVTQKHIPPCQQGQITRVKLLCNILLDLFCLLLTIGAATYLGGRVGAWASNYGLWTGLAAGMAVGFTGAFGVRSLWGRIMRMVWA